MNTTLASIIVATTLLTFQFPGFAQTETNTAQTPKGSEAVPLISPVRITASKSFKWQHEPEKKPVENGKTNRRPNKSATLTLKPTAVHYDIEVSNTGVKALGDVQIKWAVLLHGDEVKEGQSTGNLGIGGILNVKTGYLPVEKETDVTGYMVEVVAGGQVIATEQDPKGIKDRIEANRKNESKSTHKKKVAKE